ncbi:hypothetical protein CPLU01_03077 [Colletotrichum plurivorum]|uniref:Uncharacterized protein n=1 Tax=Colletotrichum plurivorum TaxID=2175906 RepID=A0A8H6NLQ7_9PEZI|nr:hypothetical protein CPLU01_03077 [Colletotrichum plurivorum]
MPRDHSSQDSRKSKSKEGSRGSNRSNPPSASSSRGSGRSGSSSSRTSHHSASSSSSGRQSSSHVSARGYSGTNPRDDRHRVAAQNDFASQRSEQGSQLYDGSYVDETRDITAGSARRDRQQYARDHPGVAFNHDRPRYSNHATEINNANRVLSYQGYQPQSQGSASAYYPDLEFDSDDASNQDSPPYRGDRR